MRIALTKSKDKIMKIKMAEKDFLSWECCQNVTYTGNLKLKWITPTHNCVGGRTSVAWYIEVDIYTNEFGVRCTRKNPLDNISKVKNCYHRDNWSEKSSTNIFGSLPGWKDFIFRISVFESFFFLYLRLTFLFFLTFLLQVRICVQRNLLTTTEEYSTWLRELCVHKGVIRKPTLLITFVYLAMFNLRSRRKIVCQTGGYSLDTSITIYTFDSIIFVKTMVSILI